MKVPERFNSDEALQTWVLDMLRQLFIEVDEAKGWRAMYSAGGIDIHVDRKKNFQYTPISKDNPTKLIGIRLQANDRHYRTMTRGVKVNKKFELNEMLLRAKFEEMKKLKAGEDQAKIDKDKADKAREQMKQDLLTECPKLDRYALSANPDQSYDLTIRNITPAQVKSIHALLYGEDEINLAKMPESVV